MRGGVEIKSVAVIGATGYLGSVLAQELELLGYAVIRISRSREGNGWRKYEKGCIDGADAVFNFAGKSIDCRWDEKVKAELVSSRVQPSQQIYQWVEEMSEDERPQVYLCASGIGIFGENGANLLEDHALTGLGFIAELCSEWEKAANELNKLGVRVVSMRFGAVLGEKSAAWQKMSLPYKFFVGGHLGSGKGYFSWIHERDAVLAMVHAMQERSLSGGINFVASAITHGTLAKVIGRKMKRPSCFPVPEFMLKLLVGEFADALLTSIRAIPSALDDSGFQFQYREIENAVEELLSD